MKLMIFAIALTHIPCLGHGRKSMLCTSIIIRKLAAEIDEVSNEKANI